METVPLLFLTGLIVGYFVLAGCDIGLGMATPYLARTPVERRRLVSAIAPYFLGTEVWLVGAVGVIAGLFPSLKGVLFEGGMWGVFTVLLAGWLLRDTGLWMRARVDADLWRSTCDLALSVGSWLLAVSWGLAIGGLLSGGDPLAPFSLVCALTVALLFLLRGAAFGAERLVPDDGSASESTGAAAPGADEAARVTRVLARTGLAAVAVTAALALVPGAGLAVDRPLLLAAVGAVPAVALAATSGLSGPHLSRHTSAVAIGAVPLLAAALALPLGSPPTGTLLLTGTAILPMVPLMVVGQVALYRMLRRPAEDHGFFVTPPPPQDSQPGRTIPVS